MNEVRLDVENAVAFVKPDSVVGAVVYLAIFLMIAMLLSRALRGGVHAAMTRKGHADFTTISFFQQFGSALIWVIALILYAHLIPVLRSMGTALLAGASVASIVLGLAAQSTLGNLVAGISIMIYRPFRLGDTLQVAAPTGTEIGVVEFISLGYTTLRATDERQVVLPNAIAASQVTINLSTTHASSAIVIKIRVSKDADVEVARQIAGRVAADNAGEKNVVGCFLTEIEAETVTFELRLAAPETTQRDALRSTILGQLAQRFRAAGVRSQYADRLALS
jgi:small-conductance mechanosensitive channel